MVSITTGYCHWGKLQNQAGGFARIEPGGAVDGVVEIQPPAGGRDGERIMNTGLNPDQMAHAGLLI